MFPQCYKKKKKLVLVCGRTASGKSSIVRAVCEKHNLKQVVSYTTRPMRPGEINGEDHVFISPNEIDIFKDNMAAYTKIGDYEYFATYDLLDQSTFYVIDPAGIRNLLETCGNRYDYVVVYVCAPRGSRRVHALTRGDDPDTVSAREVAEDGQFSEFEGNGTIDWNLTNDKTFEEAATIMEYILYEEEILRPEKPLAFAWNLTEKSWNQYQKDLAEDTVGNGDYLGCCRVGELSFDIVAKHFGKDETKDAVLTAEVFIGGIDSGYGYSAEDALKTGKYRSKYDVPEDEMYPYTDFDSDVLFYDKGKRRLSYQGVSLDAFKKEAEGWFSNFIFNDDSYLLYPKANDPLHIW